MCDFQIKKNTKHLSVHPGLTSTSMPETHTCMCADMYVRWGTRVSVSEVSQSVGAMSTAVGGATSRAGRCGPWSCPSPRNSERWTHWTASCWLTCGWTSGLQQRQNKQASETALLLRQKTDKWCREVLTACSHCWGCCA